MNKILTNLSQAKSNPHVFWPVALAVALRVGPQIFFNALDIYAPNLKGQNAAMQDMIEPYLKDAAQALTSYAALAAANSGPATPDMQSNPPAPPPSQKP